MKILSLFRVLFVLAATVLSLLAVPAMADEPVTKWQFGCEWQKASDGNYWFKVDGGCKHWLAMGYERQRDLLGWDKK